MELWKKWLCRGMLGWVAGWLGIKVLSVGMQLVNETVKWLPRVALAWVPGVNVLWFFILIVSLGRFLSSSCGEGFFKSCCYNAAHKRCFASYCACIKKIVASVCCGRKKVAIVLPNGEGYRCAILTDTYEKDGKMWGEVMCSSIFGVFRNKQLIAMSDMISLDEFKSVGNTCETVCDDEGECK